MQISGRDVASFFFNTRKGFGRLAGAVYWLFRWKVTVPESAVFNRIWPMRDAVFIKSYLKSRKITLAGSNHFSKLPKQQYVNSCGAQCLRQAAYELGIKSLPKNRLYKFDGQSIEDSSAEAAIYGITARLVRDYGGLKSGPGGNLNNGGYSGPVGIQNAIMMLGLDGRCYCSSRLTDWYFTNNDPAGWKEVKKHCPVHRSSPPHLCRNERLLIHVCNYSMANHSDAGLGVKRDHYIMKRPDGSCYDPQTGRNYVSVKAYSGMSPSGG